jgi:hypothetical protein
MRSKIEQQVMASVGVVYAVRKATSRLALECYALVLSLAGTAYFVSLPHVWANFMHVANGGVLSVGTFVITAVLSTKLVVQIAVSVGAIAFILMAVDVVRGTSQQETIFA